MILLDTSVLSVAFRRSPGQGAAHWASAHVADLIRARVAVGVPGIILLEILGGTRTAEQRTRLQNAIAGFPVVLATTGDHVRAAEVRSAAANAGIAAATVDTLIAAQALERSAELFTLDVDFEHVARVAPLLLHRP